MVIEDIWWIIYRRMNYFYWVVVSRSRQDKCWKDRLYAIQYHTFVNKSLKGKWYQAGAEDRMIDRGVASYGFFYVRRRPCWSVGISSLWDWRHLSKGEPLRSLILPELCTRKHAWSARKNYSAMVGNWTRSAGRTDSELSHWAIIADYE